MTADELDAVRDALGLLRAVHDGSKDGIAAMRDNLAAPAVTAVVLAEMLDGAMDAHGDRIEALNAWQRAAGI
jgi:hypothetical protein